MLNTQNSLTHIALKWLFISFFILVNFAYIVVANALADEPMAVDLVYFRAVAVGNDIRIEWKTGAEIGTGGFYVQRGSSKSGPFNNISEFVDAEGDVGGFDYTILDENVENGEVYWYRLVELETDNTQVEYDNFLTSAVAGGTRTPTPQTINTGDSNTDTPIPTSTSPATATTEIDDAENTSTPESTNAPQSEETEAATTTAQATQATNTPRPSNTPRPTNTPRVQRIQWLPEQQAQQSLQPCLQTQVQRSLLTVTQQQQLSPFLQEL